MAITSNNLRSSAMCFGSECSLVSEADIATVRDSGMFDLSFYILESGEQFADQSIAIVHYLDTGWHKGFNPSNLFDTNYYLRQYESVRSSGFNPLLHYILDGQKFGWKPRLSRAPLAIKPKIPIWADWIEIHDVLRSRKEVDFSKPIIVFRGSESVATLPSMMALVRAGGYAGKIIYTNSNYAGIINPVLKFLEKLGLIEIFSAGHETITRLTAFANNGHPIAVVEDGAVVQGDWLARLTECLKENVGAVNPISNHGGALSYPYQYEINSQISFSDTMTIDLLCSSNLCDRSIELGEITSGCILFSAQCWIAMHNTSHKDCIFDIECNEITKVIHELNFKIAACLSVFVSFSSKLLHLSKSEEKIDLKTEWASIDIARAAYVSDGRGVLFVSHQWGGGIERHIADLVPRLEQEHRAVFIARPSHDASSVEISALGKIDFPNLPKLFLNDTVASSLLISKLSICRVHVHSLVGWNLNNARSLIDTVLCSGLVYDFTVHDYTPVCPRLHMIDWGGSYCDSPSVEYCSICIEKSGTLFGKVDVKEWRTVYFELLSKARRVIVPDIDVKNRLLHHGQAELSNIIVRPHPLFNIDAKNNKLDRSNRTNRPLTVGVIGGIGWNKGYNVLLALAADAYKRMLPINFIIYGFSHPADLCEFPNVQSTGRYQDSKIDSLILENPCDYALFPSVGPETYGYTLDIAFRLGLFAISFDIGSTSRRIAEYNLGQTIPLGLAYDPNKLNDLMLNLEPDWDSYDKDYAYYMKYIFEEDRWVSFGEYYDDSIDKNNAILAR